MIWHFSHGPSFREWSCYIKAASSSELLRLQNQRIKRSLFRGLPMLHKTLVFSKQWTFVTEGRRKIWGSSCRWEWDYVSGKSLSGGEVCASLSESFEPVSSLLWGIFRSQPAFKPSPQFRETAWAAIEWARSASCIHSNCEFRLRYIHFVLPVSTSS